MQAGYNIPCLGIATPAGSLFSIPGSGIDESVISGSRDTAGIIDWQKYINVDGEKLSVFITEPLPQSTWRIKIA